MHELGGATSVARTMSPSVDERITELTAPVDWKISPVTNLANIEALPPAARNREIKKAADTFASTGRNVFVHYVTSILEERCERLLASCITMKKYTKIAPQLWQNLDADEAFFWNEAARELRLCMKKNILSAKGCLIHAGRQSERSAYIWHAEIAVATYLNPSQPEETTGARISDEKASATPVLNCNYGMIRTVGEPTIDFTLIQKDINAGHIQTATAGPEGQSPDQTELLDSLPERFEYEPRILYSHFARYDYDEIRKAEGKHQMAMLRQLADRFVKTGKILFYYYMVPRLCKQCHPPTTGETVASQAAELWRFLRAREKDEWLNASATLKKKLGDGNIEELETESGA